MKDNIRHFLEKNGTELADRERIISLIFTEDGLVFSENDLDYSKRLDDLRPFFQKYPKFQVYWDRYMQTKIEKYVYEPLKTGELTKLWTNNNSESMNHKLKQAVDWKQHKLPEAIGNIHNVAIEKLLDLRRALFGEGNFKLFGQSESHYIDPSDWRKKTYSEKENIFRKFLTATLKTEKIATSKFIEATSNKFKTIKPRETAGKKPGQRKRPIAERTTTITHK